VIDMEPRFIARHARDGAQFEFADDNRWNATGHEEAARVIVESSVFRSVMER
jgi:hypothetical protein